MVGRVNSPDSSRSSSGSVSRRSSRDRSLSIASSIEDDDIVKPKNEASASNEDDTAHENNEVLANAVIGDEEEGLGENRRPDDLDLDDHVTKQSSDTIESSGKKSRKSSLANKSRSGSIVGAGNKSRSGSIMDIFDSNENTTEIQQLETDLEQTKNKSRSGSIYGTGHKSRSGSIVDPDILDSSENTTEIERKKTQNKSRSGSIYGTGNKSRSGSIVDPDILDSSEIERKKTQNKSRSGSIKSVANKSRSGSIVNPDILDSSESTQEIKQSETELRQTENKSRSGSIKSVANKSRSGSIVNPEQLDTSQKLNDRESSSIINPNSTLDILEKTPEKKSLSDISTTRREKSVSRDNSKIYDEPKSNSNSSTFINTNLDLSARDQERGKFAFSIYDFDGSGRMDGFYLGDVLRALNLNPTNAVLQNLGGTFRKREKIFTVEEFLPAYSECKKIKNAGSFEDFMEVLKTYDKMEDGNVVVSELEHILLHLGERMEKSEIDAVFADCLPEEDDEGCIEYEHFLRKLCEGFI